MAKSSDNKTVRRGIYLFIDGKEVKNDIDSIQKECRKLESAVKRMQIGSEEYVRTMERIRALKGIINEHNQSIRQTREELSKASIEAKKNDMLFRKMADGFNNYIGMITTFIAGITGVMLTMRKAVNDYLSLDSVYSDVMKYTGMTRDEVVDLNESLKRMDTRTARTELNRLAGEAGKLGIQGKQNLLDFVQAADIINVSLGEDLGEDAIKNIGKLAQMFGDADRMGLKKAMLSIGSVVNYLGSTSSAAEGYLTEFIARMAGVGKQAELDIPKIAGYGAVLDQDMQKLEASSTALQNIIMKVYQAPAKFAQLARMDVQKFTELVKTDVNEAFLQLLGSLGKLGNMNVLAPIFKEMKLDGSEATAVLADLAKNVNNIRAQQAAAAKAFQEGTSVVDEFNTKNNDLTAGMEKAKKVFQERVYQLGQQLLPLMSKLVTTSSLTVKGLSALVGFLIKYGDVVMILSAGLLLAAMRQRLFTMVMVAWNGVCKLGTALVIAHNLAIAKMTQNTSKGVAAVKALDAALVGHNTLLVVIKAAVYLTSSAYLLLTGNIKKAQIAFKAFTALLATNPWTLLITVITAAAAGIYAYYKNTREAKTVTEEFYASVMQERAELDTLYSQLLKTNTTQAERARLIGEFNNKFGHYLGHLLDEKATIQEIKEAYGEAVVAMNDYYARKLLDQKAGDIYADSTEEEAKLLNRTMGNVTTMTEGQKARVLGYVNEIANTMMAAGGKFKHDTITDAVFDRIREEMNSSPYDLFGGTLQGWEQFAHSLQPYIDSVAKRINKINQIKNELAPFMNQQRKTANDIPERFVTSNDNNTGGKSTSVASESHSVSTENQEALAEEKRFQDKLAELKKKYLEDDKMTREVYQQELEKLEMEHLKNMFALYESDPKKQQEVNQQLLDMQIRLREALRKADEESRKDASEAAFTALEKQYQLEVEEATRNHYKNLTSEELFRNELAAIQERFFQKVLDSTEVSEENKRDITRQVNEKSLEEEKSSYEKKVSQFNSMSNAIIGAAEQMGKAMGDFFANEEKDFGKFMGQLVSIMLDAIEKQLIAQQAAAIASVTMKEITIKGLLGIATAAAKIALITAAFETAKSALGGFSSGGYTPSGPWNQPQGIVHSDEFVSNRFAVANPNLRPVFDLIDYAQRNNTVANLTGDDIAAVVPASARTSRSITPTVTPVQSVASDSSALLAMLAKLAESNERLMKRLDEPVTAIATVSGNNGIKKALDDYERLMKNKSR